MKRLVLSLIALLVPLSVFADGFILVEPTPDVVFRHLPHRHPRFAPLSVAFHQVEVRIEDAVAFTSVDEEFVNPSGARLEGTYLFPLPKGAQIDRFSMFIDGKECEAELLPAEKARGLYEDIVRRMKDPALLEYAGQDLFKARIFPIEPNGRKRIRISYRQVLKADGGMLEYVYPLNTEKFSSQPIERVSLKVEVSSHSPIRALYSSSHKVEISRKDEKHATVGFEEKGTKPDTDFHLCVSRDVKDLGMSLLAYRPDPKQDGYFALLASPGLVPEEKGVFEKDIVFVLDTSGSMADKGKLDQARKALRFCLANLNPGDRFEILRFSTEAEPFFNALKPCTEENRKAAGTFLDGLKPIGGTAIDEALEKALALRTGDKDRPFLVVFLTDGQPTIGERDPDAIVKHVERANSAATRVFCLGVGTDLNAHLMDRITEVTRASGLYVLPDEDLEVKVSGFYARIKSPVLTQIALSWGANLKVSKVHPGAMPDLFQGDQLVVFGRYTGSGPAAVTVEGRFKDEARRYVMEGTFPDESRERPWVARLWAGRRVGTLLDEIRLRGESKELKDEVTELAREFGIVTPYTSYLILEDEAHRNLPAPARVFLEMEGDHAVRERAKDLYDSFEGESSGPAAIEGRNDSAELKVAGNAQQLFSARGLGKSKGGGNYASQVRNVGSKTFYRNGEAWLDADAQPTSVGKVLKFGSEEYFALLKAHPEAAEWLSVGTNLRVVLSGIVYQITE